MLAMSTGDHEHTHPRRVQVDTINSSITLSEYMAQATSRIEYNINF